MKGEYKLPGGNVHLRHKRDMTIKGVGRIEAEGIIELYKQGWSIEDLTTQYGVHRNKINEIISHAGLQKGVRRYGN